MNRKQAVLVNRLQENLSIIRRIAGWTGEDLGSMIGMTRQAVNKLEKQGAAGSTKMSVAQYIAIRHLLDHHVECHPENRILPQVMNLLLDDQTIVGNAYNLMREYARTIAASAADGADAASQEAIYKVLLDDAMKMARNESERLFSYGLIAEDERYKPDKLSWTERIVLYAKCADEPGKTRKDGGTAGLG